MTINQIEEVEIEKFEKVDERLRVAVGFPDVKSEIVDLAGAALKAKNLPKCNWEIYLKSISRPIKLREMLWDLTWHITPVFDEQSYRCSEGGYDKIFYDDRLWCIGGLNSVCANNKNFMPNGPGLIPLSALKIAKQIRKFKISNGPFVLYKPNEWNEIDPDPAIVAKVGGNYETTDTWRVFAIWGDIGEQAEIISFQKEPAKR